MNLKEKFKNLLQENGVSQKELDDLLQVTRKELIFRDEKFEGCITRKMNSNNIVIQVKSDQREIEISFTPENFAFALTAQPKKCEVKEKIF